MKYLYKNLFEISGDGMNFISNEVVDYISSSIHHVSSYDEIEYIKTVFYEKIPDKTSLLGHFAFQELMWYKCVNNKIMYVQNCNRGFNDFKECFKSPIYILGNDVFYLLHLFTLKNRDVIYLINNCFIHVSVYGILNVMDVNDDGEKTLLGGINLNYPIMLIDHLSIQLLKKII